MFSIFGSRCESCLVSTFEIREFAEHRVGVWSARLGVWWGGGGSETAEFVHSAQCAPSEGRSAVNTTVG